MNGLSKLALQYVGAKQGDELHKTILANYNSIKPLPRGYKVKNTDSWCATFVSAMMYGLDLKNPPYECSCTEMTKLARKNGQIVTEPQVDDIVMYDWKNDNTIDHVGIIYAVEGNTLYVVEGNKGHAVAKRIIDRNDKTIECFIRVEPMVKEEAFEKNLDDVVRQVINGVYGNGENRKVRLEAEGYTPEEVKKIQQKVNEYYNNNKPLIDDVARDVIAGKYGNGNERRKKLQESGFDYGTVQARVNEILRGE